MYSSAKKLQRVLSSREIRKTFLDYFTINHEHKFIRSSPVVPFCDPTVAFVNAGMNQFKSVFLGTTNSPYKRVVNSQKCVRVGGKHNDLTIVGQDGYHHTFFEMLGNWSFGDYFKREACEMALELLRGPYNIDASRLYVTYFAGDDILGLPADIECFEIWRSLGFPVERILPFGCKENFWEMGTTGPCGPCTEIHIDHHPEIAVGNERAKLVNAGYADLTELWNLVFIQYNRNEDGSITPLPACHVDTGMGFERLTAVLQNKMSNYDTDLFTPIFDTIQRISKAPHYEGSFPTVNDSATLDTGYRILADHTRMVTACLADGMLPDQNQKLRRVLRKAFMVSENIFANKTLLSQLVPIVVDSLGAAYPEMITKQNDVLELIAYEQDVYNNLRSSSAKAFAEVLSEHPKLEDVDLMECPGFVPAFRDFQQQKSTFKNNTIPGSFLYKLRDTYGLTEENFQKLAELENMSCDLQSYKNELELAKKRSKLAFANEAIHNKNLNNDTQLEGLYNIDVEIAKITRHLPDTDNNPKYNYEYHMERKEYHIPELSTTITALMRNDQVVNSFNASDIERTDIITVITKASNFYYESGGQESDCGQIKLLGDNGILCELDVFKVMHVNNCVVHLCRNPTSDNTIFSTNSEVQLHVDADHRMRNICHHTATHLLNAAIRTLFKKVTYQVSSVVNRNFCRLEVGLIGKRITKDDVQKIDDLVSRTICANAPVQIDVINAADVLQQNDITMVPGEIYPETGLRLVNIKCDALDLKSKELCCGTHVRNTNELQYFCITNLKQTNRARYAFTAVAGKAAEEVLTTAALLRHRVDNLEAQYKSDKVTNATELELQKIRNNILHTNMVLPYAFKISTLERINEILRKLKKITRTTLKEFVEVEMRNVLHEKPPHKNRYILHYISSSALMREIPLQKATEICTDRPILVIGMCDNIVKARCCVPKNFQSAKFNAEQWLKVFASVFNTNVTAIPGQEITSGCFMKGKKVSTQFEEQLELAMARANKFAAQNML